jgi:hypothetical protein
MTSPARPTSGAIVSQGTAAFSSHELRHEQAERVSTRDRHSTAALGSRRGVGRQLEPIEESR